MNLKVEIKYQLEKANCNNIDIIKKYKLASILDYANNISVEEKNKIINYVENNLPKQLQDYQVIISNNKIIGCVLVEPKDDGILIDELYIESEYRNMGIGSNILKQILNE